MGMEYDAVQLVNDFITEEKLEKINEKTKKEERNISKINEEINLLYVAITRTRNRIHIPEALIPAGFPRSPQIHIMKGSTPEEKRYVETPGRKVVPRQIPDRGKPTVEKVYTIDDIRAKHRHAYKPWTTELDDELTVMYCEGVNVRDMAKQLGRTKGAIRARIIKLELEELYG
jgi:F-box protein, helicase, 18